jgi:glucose-1-phosphate cytidylyltransferase
VIDTGLETQTGGRIKKCMEALPGERIIATYGDGLANVNIKQLLDFHNAGRKLCTLTAVRPPARFGFVEVNNGQVVHFGEKNQSDAGWINGGFFVIEPEVKDFVLSDIEPFETGAIPRLVAKNNLMAYEHYGFWQPMDTLREKLELESLAASPSIPWLEIV